jgi:hypothetical protein
MNCIIKNLHSSTVTSMEKQIKEAVFPPNMYEHFDVDIYIKKTRKDHTNFDYYKGDNYYVHWKDFIRKISIINISKIINSMTNINLLSDSDTNICKLISWHTNGKKKKVEIEISYLINNDTIRNYSIINWDNTGNIVNKGQIMTINNNLINL